MVCLQSCKTQSGQYCHGSNRWCYWTFFPTVSQQTLRQLNVALLDGEISEQLCAGRALFSSQFPTSGPRAHSTAQQNDRGASSVPGTSSQRATAQISVEPPLPGPWGSPLCNILSRVRAPTQAPASTDKPVECFPADFWVCQVGLWLAGPRHHAQVGAGRQWEEPVCLGELREFSYMGTSYTITLSWGQEIWL